MNFDPFIYSLPAIITLGFKAALFWYARKSPIQNKQTQLFLFFLFALALNNLAEIFTFYDSARGLVPTVPLELYFVSAICALAMFVHLFVSIALNFAVSKHRPLVLSLLYGSAATLLFLLLFTSLLVAGFTPLGHAYYRIPGPLYPLFEIFAITCFIVVFAVLLHAIAIEPVQQKKSRMKIMIVGITPMMVLVVTNISLMHFGVTWLSTPITLPITITFLLLVTTYAIHQYRVFDIQFYLPWSRLRRRKTAFYDRVRAMITEIADLGSAGDIMNRLSATLGCSVALISRDRSIVAAGAGATEMTGMPKAILQDFSHIVVANEIAETRPDLYRAMKEHRIAAVVPFYPHSVHASGWLLLGDSFDDQVYSSLDFRFVEQLFDKMADLFLDKLLTMRTHLADASRSIRDLQGQRQELTANLLEVQKQNELLHKQNELLRRERPIDSLSSLSIDGSGALGHEERFASTITLLGRDKEVLKRLRLRFSQVQSYVGISSAGFRSHPLPEVLVVFIDNQDVKTHAKLCEFLVSQRETIAALLYGPAAADFIRTNRSVLLGGIIEALPPDFTDELLVRRIRTLAAMRQDVCAISESDQPLIGQSPVFLEQMAAAHRLAGFREPLLLQTTDSAQALALATHIHKVSRRPGQVRIWQAKPTSENSSQQTEFGPDTMAGLATAAKDAHDGTLIILGICELSTHLREQVLTTAENANNVRLIAIAAGNAMQPQDAIAQSFAPFVINMPHLRERKSDVAALVNYFTLQFNLQSGAQRYLNQSEIDDLLESAYPENVATLKQSVFIRLTPKLEQPSESAGAAIAIETEVGDKTLDDYVAELEARVITQTLERCGGNKSKAARLLGLRPNTLHYKLERYGIAPGKTS